MDPGDFGDLIRQRRNRLGLSASRVAELIGRAPATVRSWERGRSSPNDPDVLSSLAAVLGVDEGTIFEVAGVERPSHREAPTIEESLASIAPSSASPVSERAPRQDLSTPPAVAVAPVRDGSEGADPEDEALPVAARIRELWDRLWSKPDTAHPRQPTVVVYPHMQTAVRPPSPSYLEDPEQRLTYRARTVYTAIAIVATLIVLVWATGNALEALGETWDAILGDL